MRSLRGFKIACMLFLVACSTASAAIDVRLRARVQTSGSMVRLGDVAEIVAVDRERGRELAAIALMPAPAPGTQRFVPRRTIEDLLAAQGIDQRELQFDGATQVAIASPGDGWNSADDASGSPAGVAMNRHAAVLAGQSGKASVVALSADRAAKLREELRRIIESYLSDKAGRVGQWRVTCDVADRHLALLAAATSPPVCQGGSAPWTGRQRFIVAFNMSKGAVQIPVYAEVAASMPVVIAVRPIERGAVITAADVELRNVDFLPKASERRSAVDSIEAIVGMEAHQAIQAGEVVFSDQVRAAVLVKRGEIVRVSSQAGGIRVRTTARARQDGARGELVQVETLDSRERFDARVTGPREAAVFAIARPAKDESAQRIDTARR